MIISMRTITMTETPQSALYAWLSPSFPVGGFAFSHGLEWAVESGDIANAKELEAWLGNVIEYGAIHADAILLSLAWQTPTQAATLNELALALATSSERHLETAAQGTAFLVAVSAAWPTPDLSKHASFLAAFDDIAYPVAVGLAAASHGIALRATLEAFLIATLSNLVSAVLRLGPIGQSEAQAIIARLTPVAMRLAAWAETATEDDLGTCTFRSDIAAMRHETQYSRLFRS